MARKNFAIKSPIHNHMRTMANCVATAKPIPFLDPVTKVILFSKFNFKASPLISGIHLLIQVLVK